MYHLLTVSSEIVQLFSFKPWKLIILNFTDELNENLINFFLWIVFSTIIISPYNWLIISFIGVVDSSKSRRNYMHEKFERVLPTARKKMRKNLSRRLRLYHVFRGTILYLFSYFTNQQFDATFQHVPFFFNSWSDFIDLIESSI